MRERCLSDSETWRKVLALSSPEKASPREDVVDQCGRVKCMVPRHRETEKEREKGGGAISRGLVRLAVMSRRGWESSSLYGATGADKRDCAMCCVLFVRS